MSPLGGGVSGKGMGDSRKLTAEEELNHNILEAAEDIDLNDDDVDVTTGKSTVPSHNGASTDQAPSNHHLSPLEQVSQNTTKMNKSVFSSCSSESENSELSRLLSQGYIVLVIR